MGIETIMVTEPKANIRSELGTRYNSLMSQRKGSPRVLLNEEEKDGLLKN